MSDAKVCDRCETVFAGPALARIQLGRAEVELCQECAEELEEWWSGDEDTDVDSQTLGEHLTETDQE
jgi:protein-arginine kinase activator protein McsA